MTQQILHAPPPAGTPATGFVTSDLHHQLTSQNASTAWPLINEVKLETHHLVRQYCKVLVHNSRVKVWVKHPGSKVNRELLPQLVC